MNIGNPDELTVLELAQLVLEVTGSSSEIVFEPLPVDDPVRRRPDITLAEQVLGWRPEIDLREGLSRTYDWYDRGGLGMSPVPASYKKLSVIVPVFDERNTVGEIVRRMRAVDTSRRPRDRDRRRRQ